MAQIVFIATGVQALRDCPDREMVALMLAKIDDWDGGETADGGSCQFLIVMTW